jgi:hypothetical protein
MFTLLTSQSVPDGVSQLDRGASESVKEDAHASESAVPFCCTNCWHVATPVRWAQLWSWPGTPVEVHADPAQSPHKVVSKMALWPWKNWNGLQPLAGTEAVGVPQPEGTGACAVMSDGMFCLGKNQTETPELSQSTAEVKFII